MSKSLFTSNKDAWETPQWLFDQLNEEFHFELDAAASIENAKCDFFHTKETNGLTAPWAPKTTWINPPYGRDIGLWVEKASEEGRKGATVVMLLPARTDTKYFHNFIWDTDKHCPKPGVEVRFLKGRLKFGGATNSAPFPSMVAIFRPSDNE